MCFSPDLLFCFSDTLRTASFLIIDLDTWEWNTCAVWQNCRTNVWKNQYVLLQYLKERPCSLARILAQKNIMLGRRPSYNAYLSPVTFFFFQSGGSFSHTVCHLGWNKGWTIFFFVHVQISCCTVSFEANVTLWWSLANIMKETEQFMKTKFPSWKL